MWVQLLVFQLLYVVQASHLILSGTGKKQSRWENMGPNWLQDDLENLVGLSRKWYTIIHQDPPTSQHNPIPYDSNNYPSFRLHLVDDYRSDLTFMESVTDTILLRKDVRDISTNLAEAATELQLSHISYSTITEVLVALQDTERIAKRISNHFSKLVTKLNQFLGDVQNFSSTAEFVERMRNKNEDGLNGSMSNFSIEEEEKLALKKISKYVEATNFHLGELEAAGLGQLCPSIISSAFISQKSTEPLPRESLLAFSTIIQQEDVEQSELLRDLTAIYGPGSFSSEYPIDRVMVETEIQRLKVDCKILEEQLRSVSDVQQHSSTF